MSSNRFTGITSRLMMAIASGLLALSYVSMVVNPAKAWILVIFGLLFVPLFLLNLILLLWAIKRRSKSFIIPLLTILPSLFFTGRYIQFFDSKPESSQENIKMVSYNVGRFAIGGRSRTDLNSNRDSIVSFLKKQDADIICLQEFRSKNLSDIKSFLSSQFPVYHPVWYLYSRRGGSYGNVILSRLPIKGKGKIIFENSTNLAIYADVLTSKGLLRVYNCHFESYSISLSRIVKSIGKDRNVLKETETKMRNSIARRPKQVDQVFRHIGDSPYESIVCGDFNDSPVSYTYYKMCKGREDSFVRAGVGFGATYSTFWPLLRIDYVLYPQSMEAVSHQTPRVGYSDHYPVVVEISQ